MENKQTSKNGSEATVGVERLVMHLVFDVWNDNPDDLLIGTVLPDGDKISILDRLTGWGDGNIRDIETGYRAQTGEFWLASGCFDIRDFPNLTVSDAIQKIKDNANTCIGA